MRTNGSFRTTEAGAMSATAQRQRWAAIAALAVVAACLWPSEATAAGAPLVGTFRLKPGTCTSSGASGTYFRMILANGSPTGPYLSNSDSSCSDQSYTPLQPGTDGGLRTGAYQPVPDPAFD